MKFSFKVGNTEEHEVEFYFNQIWGNLYISVDGQKIIKDFEFMSFEFTKSFSITIGTEEEHYVRIEQERYKIFGGLRKQKYRAFIDEVIVKELYGY